MTRFLQDPTGTVAGMMNNKVFSNTDYARAISPGAVIVLKQVFSHVLKLFVTDPVYTFQMYQSRVLVRAKKSLYLSFNPVQDLYLPM